MGEFYYGKSILRKLIFITMCNRYCECLALRSSLQRPQEQRDGNGHMLARELRSGDTMRRKGILTIRQEDCCLPKKAEIFDRSEAWHHTVLWILQKLKSSFLNWF